MTKLSPDPIKMPVTKHNSAAYWETYCLRWEGTGDTIFKSTINLMIAKQSRYDMYNLEEIIKQQNTDKIIFENELHLFVYDRNVLTIKVKDTLPTEELLQHSIDQLSKIGRQEELAIIIDASKGIALNTEQCEYILNNFNSTIKALAILDSNWMTRYMYRIMTKLNQPKFPMKFVANKKQGVEWLLNLSK